MSKNRQTVGIYQDGKTLKIAALSGKKEVRIERLDQPKTFSPEQWPGLLATGIPGEKVMIRHVRSPLKKGRALLKTLPFQLETLIPFSLDEIIAHPIYRQSDEETIVSFFVITQEVLKKHIQSQVQDPAWVSAIPGALVRFASFAGKKEESYIIFHIEKKATEIVSSYQDVVQHHISIRIGLEHLEKAYKKDGKKEKKPEKLNLRRLTKKEHPNLTNVLKQFEREVDRAFCFLEHKQNPEQLRYLFFTGETETHFQIENFVMGLKSFSFTILPIQNQAGYEGKILKSYAIPIGLALDALKQDEKSIQFRQGKWLAPALYKAIKKKGLKMVALSFVCACCLAVLGHVLYEKKEEQFQKRIDTFISHYVHDLPELSKISTEASSEEKIAWLDRKIKRSKHDYGYFSSPPRVADILVFLSEHPKLSRCEGKKKMEINRLHTELIKFPSVQNPYQSYKMKVNLEFTSPEAVWAREFHDAIVEDTDWVDTEEEVTWDRKQNVYTITFIFKAS